MKSDRDDVAKVRVAVALRPIDEAGSFITALVAEAMLLRMRWGGRWWWKWEELLSLLLLSLQRKMRFMDFELGRLLLSQAAFVRRNPGAPYYCTDRLVFKV